MGDPSVKISTAFTPKALMGGGKSEQFQLSTLKRAKTDAAPKVRSQGKHKDDHVLTRTGNQGALVLARMVKGQAGAPKIAQPPQPLAPQVQPQAQVPQGGQANVAPQAQAPSFPDKLARLQGGLNDMGATLSQLTPHDDGVPATKKEKDQARNDLVSRQFQVKGQAEASLTEIGGLLTEKRKALDTAQKTQPPVDAQVIAGLKAEIGQLEQARGTALGITVSCELGELGKLCRDPLPKGGAMTSLWALHGPGAASKEDMISETAIKDIGGALDAFSGGARTFTKHDGSVIDLRTFKAEIDTLAEDLEWAVDMTLGEKAIGQLYDLSRVIGVRLDYREAIGAFETLLDKDPKFPVGKAVMVMSTALPFLRANGNAPGIDKAEKAADALAALAGLVTSGDSFPGLQGVDPGFDAAMKPLKMERGASMAEDHLKVIFARTDRPFPNAEQMKLAAKPDDQLTQPEQASLLSLVANGPTVTLAEARKVLAEVIDARALGQQAAADRHDLTALNKQLSDVLTADRSKWFKPWTWGDTSVRVFNDGPQSIRKDALLMKALAKFGNEATGKDVAIFMARISKQEIDTLAREQRAFGLYPNLDLTVMAPDPANPLAHIGISNADLRAIGVTTPTDLQAVGRVVETLNKQGVGGIDQVREVNRALNDVAKIVLKSELTQGQIGGFQNERARALGQYLVNELAKDADLETRGREKLGSAAPKTLTLADPTVTRHFQHVASGLQGAFTGKDPRGWDNLANTATVAQSHETEIVRIYGERSKVDTRLRTETEFLTEQSKAENLGLKVDAHAPRGLRSAKTILAAIDAHDEFTRTGSVGARQRRDDALDRLRGFDTETMRQPWHAKITQRFRDAPTIDQVRDLKKVAEAIVFIREDAPTLIEGMDRSLGAQGRALDQVVEERRLGNPAAMQQVTDMIRSAVLNEWRNPEHAKTDFTVSGGVASETFNPAIGKARTNIETMLTSWGLDLDRFAPELDQVLYSRMTADDMLQWVGDVRWSDETIAQYKAENPAFFSFERIRQAVASIPDFSLKDSLLNRKAMTETTRGELISMLQGFQEGDKLDLKSGQRVTLDSGKIPVEPSGILGIKAKLAMAHLGQFEIERGGDGYKLSVRTGGEGKGNLDLVAGKKFELDKFSEVGVEGSVGVELGGSRLTGVTLSFPNTEAGCKALVDLVGKMVDGEPITRADWQDASDVADSNETRLKGGVNAAVTGRALVGDKVELDKQKDTLGGGFSAGINAGVALGHKGNVIESLNEVTLKGEVEKSVTIGANVAVYARLYNPMNMATGTAARHTGGQDSANQTLGMSSGKDGIKGTSDDKPLFNISENVGNLDLINIGVSTNLTYVDKWKHVQKGGLFTKCETVRQANFRQGKIQTIAVCDTPQVRALLDKDKPFAASFKAFMDLAGPSDFIAVTFALRDDKLKEANHFLGLGIAARRSGNEEMAKAYDKRAQKIVDNDANYAPAKVGLVSTTVQKSEVSNINARFVRWDTFSDGKSEHTGATLNFPK